MNFCGCDPGSDGAVVIITGPSTVTFFRTKEDDEKCSKITQYLKTLSNVIAAIEDLHPIFMANARSTFALGWACGFWHGVLDTLNIPITLVEPKIWQAEITVPVVKPYIPRSTSTKDAKKLRAAHKANIKAESIRTANDLFPGYNIDHDGVADAVCIAAWLRYRYTQVKTG